MCDLFYSFGDISQGLIFDDGLMLVAGFFIMFLYVSTMLGKFNLIEQRVRNIIKTKLYGSRFLETAIFLKHGL